MFIAQKADGDSQKPHVCSVAVVSIDNASDISALTNVVSSLQTVVDTLIGMITRQRCRIAKIKKLKEDADIFASSSDSSDEDGSFHKSSASALTRGKLAGGKKRKKNSLSSNSPVCRRVGGVCTV